jgi:hypothetical protein
VQERTLPDGDFGVIKRETTFVCSDFSTLGIIVEAPDEKGMGYRSKSLAYRRFPKGRIKVVYVEEAREIVVITVMWED